LVVNARFLDNSMTFPDKKNSQVFPRTLRSVIARDVLTLACKIALESTMRDRPQASPASDKSGCWIVPWWAGNCCHDGTMAICLLVGHVVWTAFVKSIWRPLGSITDTGTGTYCCCPPTCAQPTHSLFAPHNLFHTQSGKSNLAQPQKKHSRNSANRVAFKWLLLFTTYPRN